MSVRILTGDCRDVLRTLPDESVHCVVTSPPYFGLRDYGVDGQIGLEPTPDTFVAEVVGVFRDVRRVLRADGTLWLNLGDSYAGGRHGGGGSYQTERNWRAGNPEKNKGTSNRDGLGRVSGLKPKDLIGIPWRVAFALQADGWWLRQDIIWSKPNPMPESVADRCTKAHEYLFLLTKSERYAFDAGAIAEDSTGRLPGNVTHKHADAVVDRVAGGDHRERTKLGLKSVGVRKRGVPPYHAQYESSDQSGLDEVGRGGIRNKRSVWTVATAPFSEAHFATFPPALIKPCILAGCLVGGTVLDPFGGAGTTGLVADRLGRDAILIELNPDYVAMAERRIATDAGMFAEVAA